MNVWAYLRALAIAVGVIGFFLTPEPLQEAELPQSFAESDPRFGIIFALFAAMFGFIVYGGTLAISLVRPTKRALWDWNGRPFTKDSAAPTWMSVGCVATGIAFALATLLRGKFEPAAFIWILMGVGNFFGVVHARAIARRQEKMGLKQELF